MREPKAAMCSPLVQTTVIRGPLWICLPLRGQKRVCVNTYIIELIIIENVQLKKVKFSLCIGKHLMKLEIKALLLLLNSKNNNLQLYR